MQTPAPSSVFSARVFSVQTTADPVNQFVTFLKQSLLLNMGTSASCECSEYHENGKQEEKMEYLDLGPAADPNQKKRKISTLNKQNYILSNKSNASLTRMECNREMVIGCWTQGNWGHSSIFICYFSEFERKKKLIGRVFCIELFTTNTDTILSIKGPLYNTRNYSCKQFYMIHSNMDRLIDIAKQTMKQHGKYRYWTNNCRHFTENYLKNVKTQFHLLGLAISTSDMNQYLRAYVPNKGDIEESDGLVIEKEFHQNAEDIDKSTCHFINTPVASKYETMDSQQSDLAIIEFATPISFVQVFTKYPLNRT